MKSKLVIIVIFLTSMRFIVVMHKPKFIPTLVMSKAN